MSQLSKSKGILEIKKQNKKNSKLFEEDLILYSEEDKDLEFFEIMKKGYIEMGQINLSIAIDDEKELVDVNNYETWLCGV
ncbi:hypothetical protein ACQPU1_11615 [Clostridium paraputrificum]|uniref:hypothetical protein n=1 Tax=Clostridium TaxID=1485 RepID=UPI003D325279